MVHILKWLIKLGSDRHTRLIDKQNLKIILGFHYVNTSNLKHKDWYINLCIIYDHVMQTVIKVRKQILATRRFIPRM